MLESKTYKESRGWFAYDENKWGYFIFPSMDKKENVVICVAEAFIGKDNKFFLKKTRLNAYQKGRGTINRRIYIKKELMGDVVSAVSKLVGFVPVLDESVGKVKESAEKEGQRRFVEESGEFE